MKKLLVIDNDEYGPFNFVVETETHYQCDNFVFYYTIVGKGTVTEVANDYQTPQQIEAAKQVAIAQAAKEKEEYNKQQEENRKAAYIAEADPINFMMQRGEATEQDWLDKIAEIKARFPYYYDADGNLLEAQA